MAHRGRVDRCDTPCQPRQDQHRSDFGSVGHITTMALLHELGLGPDAVRIVTFDGAGAMRTALAGGRSISISARPKARSSSADLSGPLAVFLDHRVPENDAPPINEVLQAYHTSVPLISGSVRTFVFPAVFKANIPMITTGPRRPIAPRLDAPDSANGCMTTRWPATGSARTAPPRSSAPISRR